MSLSHQYKRTLFMSANIWWIPVYLVITCSWANSADSTSKSLHFVDRFFSGNWRRYTSKFWRIFALMNLLWIYYHFTRFDIYVVMSVSVWIEIVYLLIECSILSIVWISCTLHLRVLRVVLQNFCNSIFFIWELILLGTLSFTFREREVFTSRF